MSALDEINELIDVYKKSLITIEHLSKKDELQKFYSLLSLFKGEIKISVIKRKTIELIAFYSLELNRKTNEINNVILSAIKNNLLNLVNDKKTTNKSLSVENRNLEIIIRQKEKDLKIISISNKLNKLIKFKETLSIYTSNEIANTIEKTFMESYVAIMNLIVQQTNNEFFQNCLIYKFNTIMGIVKQLNEKLNYIDPGEDFYDKLELISKLINRVKSDINNYFLSDEDLTHWIIVKDLSNDYDKYEFIVIKNKVITKKIVTFIEAPSINFDSDKPTRTLLNLTKAFLIHKGEFHIQVCDGINTERLVKIVEMYNVLNAVFKYKTKHN